MELPLNTQVINLFGFVIGGFLYLTLGVMAVGALKHRQKTDSTERKNDSLISAESLLVVVAILGCVWNFGELGEALSRDFTGGRFFPLLSAVFYSSLGFLPALIVHLEKHNENGADFYKSEWIITAAYALSASAAGLHFFAAIYLKNAPSVAALFILAAGYTFIAAVIFFNHRSEKFGLKISRVAALILFAASLFHLGFPHSEGRLWYVEIVGHQASLPLILAVIYRNFRFSFADVFLKRAVSMILLAAAIYAGYALIVLPLNTLHANHPANDPQKTGVLLIVWMATALAYPQIYRFAAFLVDKSLLHRPDYALLKKDFMQKIFACESINEILEKTANEFAVIVNARNYEIREVEESPALPFHVGEAAIKLGQNSAQILIPTVELPNFEIILGDLSGRRQLLSEEIETLETIALQAARRIDVLRVSHERCEHELREQEFSNLATEAELRALRSQINPHFLFNALTTIGYLINTAPEKALATLLQLTGLLRGVLRSTKEFQTLGEELKLIESYLEIEKARFEERLQVEINLPEHLSSVRIPALILQPLVENAVKHGISPEKKGGVIKISAERDEDFFILRVSDNGAGIDETELRRRMQRRVGLKNIEQRLRLHFEEAASLCVHSSPKSGMSVEIKIERNALENNFRILQTPEKRAALNY